MSKPNLDRIITLLQSRKNFTLTREQYLNLTGVDVPQSKSYTENKSAVAKKADLYGFQIEVVPELLKFTIINKK